MSLRYNSDGSVSEEPTYLGDGLYAQDDGCMVTLSTDRGGVQHWVGLEPNVVMEFLRFLERARGIQIKIYGVERGGSGHE